MSTEKWAGGKGDCRRPHRQDLYEAGYEMIFNPSPIERAKWKVIWRDLIGKATNDASN